MRRAWEAWFGYALATAFALMVLRTIWTVNT